MLPLKWSQKLNLIGGGGFQLLFPYQFVKEVDHDNDERI